MSTNKESIFGKPIDSEDSAFNKKTESAKKQNKEVSSKKDEINFNPQTPHYTLSQVILPETTKIEVKNILAKINTINYHEKLYSEWGLDEIDLNGKKLVFNLYGLPGTGKSMLAEAIVNELDFKMIKISYASLESKFVGETSKNIERAFEYAKSNEAVLFFDEADSILGKRMTSVTTAGDHAVNVSRATMLMQLEDFSGIVMFATNLAKNFDPAFRRRISTHIEIPIPDLKARKSLWNIKIPEIMPGKENLDLDELAKETKGLTGAEIQNAVIKAATIAVQRSGNKQKLTMDDIMIAVDVEKRAKKDVGSPH